MLRKRCNVSLESNWEHILTIKHLIITKHLTIIVGEYTYGLPCFLGRLGHRIQSMRYWRLEYRFLYSIETIYGTVVLKIIFQTSDLNRGKIYQLYLNNDDDPTNRTTHVIS